MVASRAECPSRDAVFSRALSPGAKWRRWRGAQSPRVRVVQPRMHHLRRDRTPPNGGQSKTLSSHRRLCTARAVEREHVFLLRGVCSPRGPRQLREALPRTPPHFRPRPRRPCPDVPPGSRTRMGRGRMRVDARAAPTEWRFLAAASGAARRAPRRQRRSTPTQPVTKRGDLRRRRMRRVARASAHMFPNPAPKHPRNLSRATHRPHIEKLPAPRTPRPHLGRGSLGDDPILPRGDPRGRRRAEGKGEPGGRPRRDPGPGQIRHRSR